MKKLTEEQYEKLERRRLYVWWSAPQMAVFLVCLLRVIQTHALRVGNVKETRCEERLADTRPRGGEGPPPKQKAGGRGGGAREEARLLSCCTGLSFKKRDRKGMWKGTSSGGSLGRGTGLSLRISRFSISCFSRSIAPDAD